jgi:hypothetical protein
MDIPAVDTRELGRTDDRKPIELDRRCKSIRNLPTREPLIT